MEVTGEGIARFFEVVLPHMNEVQRRVVAGAMSEMLGRGGKTAVAAAFEMFTRINSALHIPVTPLPEAVL